MCWFEEERIWWTRLLEEAVALAPMVHVHRRGPSHIKLFLFLFLPLVPFSLLPEASREKGEAVEGRGGASVGAPPWVSAFPAPKR